MARTRRAQTEEVDHQPRDALPSDLQTALDKVGPQQYGYATAKKFAPGGEYSPEKKRKQRFALT